MKRLFYLTVALVAAIVALHVLPLLSPLSAQSRNAPPLMRVEAPPAAGTAIANALKKMQSHEGGEVLVIASSGYYLLTQDSQGLPTLTPATSHFKQVIVLTDPSPGPGPGPTPGPVLTARAIAARDAAAKATADPKRDETAVKLGLLYSEVSRKVGTGELKGADAISFVARTGADLLIGSNAAAWQPFRDNLTAAWTKVAQEGGKDADYAKLFDEVSMGLNASANKMEAMDLRQLLTLINQIIQMILQLMPPTPAPSPVLGK